MLEIENHLKYFQSTSYKLRLENALRWIEAGLDKQNGSHELCCWIFDEPSRCTTRKDTRTGLGDKDDIEQAILNIIRVEENSFYAIEKENGDMLFFLK